MSTALAIATVTAALKKRLERGLLQHQDALGHAWAVTTAAPDVARSTTLEGQDQLNLFLYQATPSAAWRSQEMPGRTLRGESSPPPLALDLHYLLTAWVPEDEGVEAQKLLGIGGLLMHDAPLLSREELETALAAGGVHLQSERIRVTPSNLSLDELSKLWTMFQKPYRTSLAFQVSVVLIESARPAVAPLPVLRMGESGAGPAVGPSLASPLPALLGVAIPGQQVAARLGETLTLTGQALTGIEITAVLRHASSGATQRLRTHHSGGALRLTLPTGADAAGLRPGLWALSLELRSSFEVPPRVTNELPLPLATQLSDVSVGVRDADQGVPITLTTAPELAADQQPTLLLGATPCPLTARAGAALTFTAPAPAPGTYPLRLRVEGIDSILIDRTATPPAYVAPTAVIP